MDTPLRTSRIGPAQVRFNVHLSVFEHVSELLRVLMKNGSMKESCEKVASLDEIDVQTCSQFIEYCYTKNYRTAPKNRCSIGSYEEETKESNPASTSASCVCKAGVIVCEGCTPTFHSSFKVKLCELSYDWDMFQTREFGSAGLSHDQIRDFLDSQIPKDEVASAVTQHAKVYIMADRYLVSPLKDLALHKPHRDLVAYDIFDEGAAEIVELIRLIYANTSDCAYTSQLDGGIRDLVTSFTISKKLTLVNDRGFMELLREGGDFASVFTYNLVFHSAHDE